MAFLGLNELSVIETEVSVRRAAAPNENIVQNHLKIALFKVF